MTGRISKGAIDRLGRRLAEGADVSPADLAELQDVRDGMYGPALDSVNAVLRDLGLNPTSRLKTVGTLVDKLRANPGSPLSRIQDLAGTRVIVGRSRMDQDTVVRHIGQSFEKTRDKDRRKDPSAGYRAVHVIVTQDSLPVEIQVRTELQHMWAEVAEKIADVWGRQLRYGGEPDEPDAIMLGQMTRRDAWGLVLRVAEGIAKDEQYEFEIEERRARLQLLHEEIKGARASLDAAGLTPAEYQNLEAQRAEAEAEVDGYRREDEKLLESAWRSLEEWRETLRSLSEVFPIDDN
jgi:hypothetical protein